MTRAHQNYTATTRGSINIATYTLQLHAARLRADALLLARGETVQAREMDEAERAAAYTRLAELTGTGEEQAG